jgi:hypothetical protein
VKCISKAGEIVEFEQSNSRYAGHCDIGAIGQQQGAVCVRHRMGSVIEVDAELTRSCLRASKPAENE